MTGAEIDDAVESGRLRRGLHYNHMGIGVPVKFTPIARDWCAPGKSTDDYPEWLGYAREGDTAIGRTVAPPTGIPLGHPVYVYYEPCEPFTVQEC